MIKDILVHLSVATEKDTAVEYAIDLAQLLDAHLAGMGFIYDPVIIPDATGYMPASYVDSQIEENERLAATARQRFDAACQKAGISFESITPNASCGGASDQFSRAARRFDLSIVMQSEPETVVGEDLIVEAALFQTGRPMLLIPYIGVPTVKIDRIMIAWDGGSSAARAVGDAMPLLRRAKAVEIVIVTGEERKRDMLPGADLAEHLARHGLNVDVKELVAADDVQPILLSYASDMSADLMVMGGYGHSRLREFILGGVTRDMFESLTIPCLMAH